VRLFCYPRLPSLFRLFLFVYVVHVVPVRCPSFVTCYVYVVALVTFAVRTRSFVCSLRLSTLPLFVVVVDSYVALLFVIPSPFVVFTLLFHFTLLYRCCSWTLLLDSVVRLRLNVHVCSVRLLPSLLFTPFVTFAFWLISFDLRYVLVVTLLQLFVALLLRLRYPTFALLRLICYVPIRLFVCCCCCCVVVPRSLICSALIVVVCLVAVLFSVRVVAVPVRCC
jgi:hypothetical protein